jgi:hypothetical protein
MQENVLDESGDGNGPDDLPHLPKSGTLWLRAAATIPPVELATGFSLRNGPINDISTKCDHL